MNAGSDKDKSKRSLFVTNCDGGVWGRTQMHRVVEVKKGFIWEQAEISRGKAKSREHKHGSKPGDPINKKHEELKLKGEGLVNQRKKIKRTDSLTREETYKHRKIKTDRFTHRLKRLEKEYSFFFFFLTTNHCTSINKQCLNKTPPKYNSKKVMHNCMLRTLIPPQHATT